MSLKNLITYYLTILIILVIIGNLIAVIGVFMLTLYTILTAIYKSKKVVHRIRTSKYIIDIFNRPRLGDLACVWYPAKAEKIIAGKEKLAIFIYDEDCIGKPFDYKKIKITVL